MDSFLSCVKSPDAFSKDMIDAYSSVFILLAFIFFLMFPYLCLYYHILSEFCLPSSPEPLIYELELFKIFYLVISKLCHI